MSSTNPKLETRIAVIDVDASRAVVTIPVRKDDAAGLADAMARALTYATRVTGAVRFDTFTHAVSK